MERMMTEKTTSKLAAVIAVAMASACAAPAAPAVATGVGTAGAAGTAVAADVAATVVLVPVAVGVGEVARREMADDGEVPAGAEGSAGDGMGFCAASAVACLVEGVDQDTCRECARECRRRAAKPFAVLRDHLWPHTAGCRYWRPEGER